MYVEDDIQEPHTVFGDERDSFGISDDIQAHGRSMADVRVRAISPGPVFRNGPRARIA
jgi:hypothetical protein